MTLAFWIYALILLESKSEYKINFWNLIFVKNAFILLAHFSNSSRHRIAIWKLFLFWNLKVSSHCHLTCIVLIDRSSIILILNPFVSLHGIFSSFSLVLRNWIILLLRKFLYLDVVIIIIICCCTGDMVIPFNLCYARMILHSENIFLVCCFMIILIFSFWNYCLLLEFWTESLIVSSNWLYFLSGFPSIFTSSM